MIRADRSERDQILLMLLEEVIDTYYDTDPSDKNGSKIYESVRMKILENKTLDKFDISLLIILLNFSINRQNILIENNTKLRTTLEEINNKLSQSI